MTDEVLTIRDIARVLKLAEKTVYAMATDGELPGFKIRGQWRVRRVDFESWLAAQASASTRGRETRAPTGPESREPVPSHPHPDPTGGTMNDEALPDVPVEPVEELSARVSQEELHQCLVRALGPTAVRAHASYDTKPFELELSPPLPQRVRVYLYNATRPPGGRPLGEHKIQLMVPGQQRGQRGSFDHGDGRIVLLMGYAADEEVFILWDAGLYPDFAWSRNVQVKAETIIQACGGKLATQERQLRPPNGRPTIETVLAVQSDRLADAIVRRMELTRERLLRD